MFEPRIEDLPRVQAALLAWHGEHGMHAPWRESRDPYHALVAAVMAQQTQMSRVLPAYQRFVAAFPTVEALAAAPPADVIRAWAGMGYNQRALRLHRAARTIVAGGWPRDAAGLREIDGVGPFTAAIVASFAFGEDAACVDTNVRRVLGRLAGCEGAGPAAMQRLADVSIPDTQAGAWNQALMDYGAQICTPRPKCAACVVSTCCATAGHVRREPMVADERAVYRPARARRQAPYEGSRRYLRGRTLDVLRALAPGERISIDALAARLAAAVPLAASDGAAREIIDSLVRDGLATVHHSRDGTEGVSLPE